MLGIVFSSFMEMMEEDYSYDTVDDILQRATLTDDGAYTSVGYYPDAELIQLLTLVAEQTNTDIDTLLKRFGRFLFARLVEAHEGMLMSTDSLFELLAHLDDEIHRQVRKMYPKAGLPHFTLISRDENTLVMDYLSPRNLELLALGLIDGAALHFGVSVEVALQHRGDVVRFTVTQS